MGATAPLRQPPHMACDSEGGRQYVLVAETEYIREARIPLHVDRPIKSFSYSRCI